MSVHPDYRQFLATKRIIDPDTGISAALDLPEVMLPHQRDITRWALRRGRAAIFAGTGLGKTLMELTWADRVSAHTGKPVLIFAPLAVSLQHIREAAKFGLSARIVKDQSEVGQGVNVTNYQKIDHFDLSAFGGIVLDESSVLKSTDGKYRTRLIAECAQVPFRLAATATPAPNDFMELGNHAEFLGVMSYTDMLATFFVHDGGDTQKWRLKGHAENEFWKWMASWAVMLRQPSDLGYPNDGYDLPPLRQQSHTVAVEYEPSLDTGLLFPMEAHTLQERIGARRDSAKDRCNLAFQVVIGNASSKLAECHGSLNTPSDGEQNTSQMPLSASVEKAKADPQNKTPNTCDPTTPKTGVSGSEPLISKRKSIAGDVNGTQRMLNIANEQSSRRGAESRKPDVSAASSRTTEWMPTNSRRLSPSKADDAPSAETDQRSIYSLIIAMKQAVSAGSFVAPATLASVISRMTQNGSIEPWCIWCNLNSEQDALAKAFGPLAYSVSGSMPDEMKEAAVFDWIDRKRPVMISKPSIMGFGMNFQHCRNTLFVGLNDSFEQIYQAIRRFWRFGQSKPVNVHFIASEMEGAVVANLRRKEADADHMAERMVAHMADLTSELVRGNARVRSDYAPSIPMTLPNWLKQEEAA